MARDLSLVRPLALRLAAALSGTLPRGTGGARARGLVHPLCLALTRTLGLSLAATLTLALSLTPAPVAGLTLSAPGRASRARLATRATAPSLILTLSARLAFRCPGRRLGIAALAGCRCRAHVVGLGSLAGGLPALAATPGATRAAGPVGAIVVFLRVVSVVLVVVLGQCGVLLARARARRRMVVRVGKRHPG